MPPVGFEPTILVSERPKTHALDRTTTGIGRWITLSTLIELTDFNLTVTYASHFSLILLQ
jgi:hypothetical protein